MITNHSARPLDEYPRPASEEPLPPELVDDVAGPGVAFLGNAMKRASVLGLLLAAVVTVAGCSSGETSRPRDFWSSLMMGGLSEVDPPESMKELKERADVVVLGTITDVREGHDYTEPDGPPMVTALVTIRAQRVVSRNAAARVPLQPGRTLDVEMMRSPVFDIATTREMMPQGSVLFFLDKVDAPHAEYVLVSMRGVVAEEGGTAVLPYDRSAGNEIIGEKPAPLSSVADTATT